MMKYPRYCFIALFAFFVGATSALAGEIRSMGGMEYIADDPPPVVWRGANLMAKRSALESETVRFTELPADRLEKVKEANSERGKGQQAKPLQIGVNRFFSIEAENKTQPTLNWQKVDGGSVAYLTVTSPDAAALRVGLKIERMPASVELRFAGSNEADNIAGVVSGQEALSLRSDNNTYWTPMTDGDTQTIEIFVPQNVATDALEFNVEAVSHVFVSASSGFDIGDVMKASGSCNINVACKYGELGEPFQRAVKAVARMTFSEGGNSYLCTGTLLNNSKVDFIPYFWSAAHCISSQTVANTLNTYWFEEASSCGGSSASYTRLSGGARLLHANGAADTLLLQLYNDPPNGAVFAGWDSTAFSSGSAIGIHHPSGDIKKVSIGKGEGRTCSGYISGGTVDTSKLDLVSWQQGTTEGGSSGSGIFTLSSDGATYYLRGGLMGGKASCSNTGQSYSSNNGDCYSGLNRVWSYIEQYLAPGSTSGDLEPSHDYRGMWYKTGEGGWGLTIDQYSYSSGRAPYLYAAWYTYDNSGKARWLLFEGAWTAKDQLSADVYQYTGTPWGPTYNRDNLKNTKVGTATIKFTSAKAATFTYNVDGVQRTVTINKSE
jgi:hypothetical protein